MRTEDWTRRYWRTLKTAVLASPSWSLDLYDRLVHEQTGCEVRLLAGAVVRYRHPGREGCDLLTSPAQDADDAAYDVAAQVRRRLAGAYDLHAMPAEIVPLAERREV